MVGVFRDDDVDMVISFDASPAACMVARCAPFPAETPYLSGVPIAGKGSGGGWRITIGLFV